ncbi:MAG: hypothetical protein KJZ86_23510 [Caldilineaceae bacterium]|nr:hypothetical protein [Caldilineaceae bacterium]HRJ41931.1 hypothetical protein [Caldilineaceae bacterium]
MSSATAERLIGRVASDLTVFPEEDLTLVVELVDYLKRQRPATHRVPLSPAQIRMEARRRAQLLCDVPRTEIVARFQQVAEEIRQDVIARGLAIDGDLLSD